MKKLSFLEVLMKKLIGLLAAGSICMIAACSSDDDENTLVPQSWQQGNNQLTQDDCNAFGPGFVLQYNAQTGVPECVYGAATSSDANQTLSSSAADPFAQVPASSGGITPIGGNASSSSAVIVAPTVSSSSVASSPASSPATQTPKSSATTTTPPATDADDGLFKLGLWDGTAGDVQVPTGNKAGGWWYSYADKLGSAITWKAELGAEGDMTPVIEACGGVCGDFVIGEGDPDNNVYPYLGFAFGYGKTNATADATSSKGICVTYSYSGDATFAIELGLTESQEGKLNSALPMVKLPAGNNKTIEFTWSEFEQPDWATTTMTGANAAKQLSSIKFKFADVTGGESGSFTIFKVGAPGQCGN